MHILFAKTPLAEFIKMQQAAPAIAYAISDQGKRDLGFRMTEDEHDRIFDWFNELQRSTRTYAWCYEGVPQNTQVTPKAAWEFLTSEEDEDVVKLLGIDIDFLINFDQQISNMCKKAAKQLNVLLRLSKFLTSDNKILIYKSFIRSNFNFCPLVWHFCSKTNSDKLEKIQHRALRITFNDFSSSYETLLDRAIIPT